MRPSRNVLIVGFLLFSTTVGSACGSDAEVKRDRFDSGSEPSASTGASYDLPFGIEEVEGSVAVGRPAVYERPADVNGSGSTVLHAVYRIEADDPAEVFDAWVTEVEESTVRLGEVHMSARDEGGPPGRWLTASNSGGNYLDLQLWTTEDEPVLLVDLIQYEDEDDATRAADEVEAGEAPSSSLAWEERGPGDALFREQGDAIHLPEGTSTLMPTVPISQGTGGSYSVFSAEDGAGAIDAMLAEGQSTSENGEVDAPTRYEYEGTTVITAGFVIPAGGWGFDVVSVQGPDDEAATVYVSSAAD